MGVLLSFAPLPAGSLRGSKAAEFTAELLVWPELTWPALDWLELAGSLGAGAVLLVPINEKLQAESANEAAAKARLCIIAPTEL